MKSALVTSVHVLIFCCLLFVTVRSHTTACNHGNNKTCLEGNATYEGLQMDLQNENPRYVWYGRDAYNASCYGKGKYTAQCMNPAPGFFSIITRMRMSDDNDTSMIAQVLDVHYGVPAGSYIGCRSHIQVPATDKRVDPVHTIYNDGWALNHRPHVNWTPQQNQKYTLVFWDAGWFRLHGMWINIDGGRIDRGQEVIPYRGPINPMPDRTVFVFALYNQTKTLDRKTAYEQVKQFQERDGFVKLNELVSKMGLEGPVGASLIRTKADTFNADRGRRENIINSCPYILTSVMAKEKDRLPWNTTDMKLSVSVDVTYNSSETDFESCCQQHKIPKMMLEVDPRASTPIEPVITRDAPMVRLVHTNLKDPFYFAHADRSFTLLLLDLTESNINMTNKAVIHWQIINIRDSSLRTGETILSYLKVSMPPFSPERRYAFLLLEQKSTLTRAQVEGIRGTNCQPEKRCNFDVSKFKTDLNLKLVGMTTFRTKRDPYSRRMLYTENSVTKPVACTGVTGFSDPCVPKDPTCAGVISLPSLFAFLLSLAVSILGKY